MTGTTAQGSAEGTFGVTGQADVCIGQNRQASGNGAASSGAGTRNHFAGVVDTPKVARRHTDVRPEETLADVVRRYEGMAQLPERRK